MKTLRETMQMVEPAGLVASAQDLGRLLGKSFPFSLRQLLEQNTVYDRIIVGYGVDPVVGTESSLLICNAPQRTIPI